MTRIGSLLAGASVLATLLWLAFSVYRGYWAWRAVFLSEGAEEFMRTNLFERRTAAQNSLVSLGLMVCLALLKGTLLVFGIYPSAGIIHILAGGIDTDSIVSYAGLQGVVLLSILLAFLYRFYRAVHYQQVLYAFRKQLEIENLFEEIR